MSANDSRAAKNCYPVQCEPNQRHCSYGVCLFVIQAFQEKRLNGGFQDCEQTIKQKRCPAVPMRVKELKAKQSLFYREYTHSKERIRKEGVDDLLKPDPNVNTKHPDYIRGRYGDEAYRKAMGFTLKPAKCRRAKSKRKAQQNELAPIGVDYGQLVTKLAKEESDSPKAQVGPRQGESVLNFIKRTRG